MEYAHRYRACPPKHIADALEHHLNIHRQAYNYTRYEYNNCQHEPTVANGAFKHHKRLPDWKDEYPIFKDVHSKALQKTVTRFYQNLSNLAEKKKEGYKVGKLKWKKPRDYQSITYSQSGFELKNTSGPDTNTATLNLTKIGDIPIRYHRPLPDHAEIKEVTVKKHTTSEWYVSFSLDIDEAHLPDKTPADELEGDNCVGIDLGILSYVHTSDGLSLEQLDVEADYERLGKAQHVLDRRECGSENWEKQRERVANIQRRIRRKILDYQHKITSWLTTEYDAVFVEDLDVKPMLEDSHNARNKQDAAWARFIKLLEYKADLNGCYVEKVEPAGTTKECSECGASTDKPVWVREHSCPSCGFELDRDWNASLNVLQRGFELLGERLGLEQSEVQRLKETGAFAGSVQQEQIPAETVVETGSPLVRENGKPLPR